ncbi:Sensor protein QseC [Ruegeria denitrificans]|uniref:histidine kinase n=1 Tax=Ruegeria denitrificans TaxID=1715692 RepID=A0A0P1IJ55_9RHOB|nr:sensor histidine kinase [Ruegeria denitrificans]CUK15696.1 Sensor protein QseC [Ruegeria denitrificans]
MSAPVAHGSIRRRLLLSLLAGAAVLAIVVYFVVQSVARQVAQESQDNVLAASALSILDSARYSGQEINVDLPYSALSMLDSISDERVFYAIRLENEFLSGYDELPEADGTVAGVPAFRSATFLEEEVRVASVRRRMSTDIGQSYLQVSVAQTLSGQKQTLARISQTSMGIGAGFFLVSVLLAAIIARSTIRPLDRLTVSVSRRGPKDLRPVAAPVPSEMVPLVASLNSFMRRLKRSLTRSEDFIAEAAHRVRTPLAIVRTKAEIVQRKADNPETRTALREMIHAIDDSSRTAGQLLDHAMVTFRLDHLSQDEISLLRLVQEAVERLRPISEMKEIELHAIGTEDSIIQGDPILLQNALHNLLDNAIKYSPAGARVTVALTRHNDGGEIRITDTGHGFPEAELDRLTDRFARGANAESIVGSGLGLTIVKEVVEAHGGKMYFENMPGGGACVSLHFPLP